MTARVLKWPVPVDDQTHRVGGGRVLLVASQGERDTVHVWTLEDAPAPLMRTVRVFGTGQPLPEAGTWNPVGSVIAGPFVWHVFEDVPL